MAATLTAILTLSQEKNNFGNLLTSQLSKCRESLQYENVRAFIKYYINQIGELN